MEMEISDLWKRKRKLTIIVFTLQNLLAGVEYSLTFLTLWLYIGSMIDTGSPKLVYGVVAVCFLLSTTLASPIVGALVDRSRNVVLAFQLCNLAIAVGNFVYALPYSPWCLICGRLLSGIGGALRAVSTGEIVRSYPETERRKILSIMTLAYTMGFVVAPLLNQFAFKNVDATIGGFELKPFNVPGIFLAAESIVMMLLSFAFVHNLSKEFDLKAELEKQLEQPTETPSKSPARIIFQLFSHKDTILLMIATFFTMVWITSSDMLLPLMVVDMMGLGITEINILTFGSGIASITLPFIYVCKSATMKQMIVIFVVTYLLFCALISVYIIGTLFPQPHIALKVFMAACYITGYAGSGIVPDVILVTVLANVVPSNIQTFCEGVRFAFFALGSACGFMFAPVAVDYLIIIATCYIAIALSIAFAFIVRSSYLINPKILING